MEKRIPTLDGWRGIAILMVLVTHYQINFLGGYARPWLEVGQHGVSIFFVLSGYLITTRLLRLERINLADFYVRRFFRLMPAAWVYLLFLVILTNLSHMKTISDDLWGCLFFFRNYVPETPLRTCTEHFWSLSVEEQFYLAWPPVLLFLGRKRSAFIAIAGALSIAAYRWFHWSYFDTDLRFLYTQARADALFVGCLLALALEREAVRGWIRSHSRLILGAGVAVFVVDVYYFRDLIPLHESIAIACMLGATSLNPALRVSKWLEFEHLKMTGVISYSIYLWQGIFLRPNWGIFGVFLLPVAVFGSWFFVERRGIAFGHTFTELSLRSSSARAACQAWLAQLGRRSQPRADRASG